jgi:tetratricopeptide (TPR) repeat protein
MWRKQFGAAILLGVALYAGVGHARYMALFAILVATLGPSLVRELWSEWNAPEEKHRRLLPEGAAVAVVAVLCLLALLHIADYASSRTYVVFGSDWRFGAGESTWLPEGAAAFIERERLPGNIFEEYALGGFESFRLGPHYPDFLDGRSDRLRPDLVVEQRSLYSAAPDSPQWQKTADSWNFNVLMVAVSGFRSLQKMNPAAFCGSEGWRAVYMDDAGMVFLRNTPQNKPWIDRLAINCAMQPILPPPHAGHTRLYDFYLSSGALYFDLNRTAEAVAALQQAQQLFPADPNVHLLLAGVEQRRGQMPQAEQEYLAALALNESSGARSALAGLYAGEGRLPEAAAALEKAATMSPQPMDMYMQLAEIELAQRLPARALTSYERAEKASPFRNGGESLVPGLYAQMAEGRAEAYRQLGQANEAIKYQLQSVQLTPGNARRWNQLAEMYDAAGLSALGGEARQRAAQAEAGTH